jgi:hypothetical protein
LIKLRALPEPSAPVDSVEPSDYRAELGHWCAPAEQPHPQIVLDISASLRRRK